MCSYISSHRSCWYPWLSASAERTRDACCHGNAAWNRPRPITFNWQIDSQVCVIRVRQKTGAAASKGYGFCSAGLDIGSKGSKGSWEWCDGDNGIFCACSPSSVTIVETIWNHFPSNGFCLVIPAQNGWTCGTRSSMVARGSFTCACSAGVTRGASSCRQWLFQGGRAPLKLKLLMPNQPWTFSMQTGTGFFQDSWIGRTHCILFGSHYPHPSRLDQWN